MIAFHPNGLVDLHLKRCMRRHVLWVVEHYCEGNRKWAAQELGIEPSTLYRQIRAGKLDLEIQTQKFAPRYQLEMVAARRS